ncbi:MAG: hypothetical protein WC510_02040 [Candidatus Omnitrophota bacterium]
MYTEQEIRNEIALLTQGKAEMEKILQDKQNDLEPLLADQAMENKNLGSGKKEKIETLRRDIERQKAAIVHIDEALPGLIKKLEEVKAAAPEIKRLIKALRDNDLDILQLLREKLIALQEVIRIERKMEDAYLINNAIREQCRCIEFNAKGYPEAYPIPINLLMMDTTKEFIAKFFPLDNQGLQEAIALIEKIIREVQLG